MNKLVKEMQRYLPVLQAAVANPDIWERITRGTGVSTLNGYENVVNLYTDSVKDILTQSLEALQELQYRMQQISYLLNGHTSSEDLAKAYDLAYPDKYQELIGWLLKVVDFGHPPHNILCGSREQAEAIAKLMTGEDVVEEGSCYDMDETPPPPIQ